MLIGIKLQLFSLFLNSASSFLWTDNIVYKVLTDCLSYPARTVKVNMENTNKTHKEKMFMNIYRTENKQRNETKFLWIMIFWLHSALLQFLWIKT